MKPKKTFTEREVHENNSCVYYLLDRISQEFWTKILKLISRIDVHEFGKEFDPHVTLFYSHQIPVDLTITEIFKFFKENLPLKLKIIDIGVFENSGYDVLYFKILKTLEVEKMKDSSLKFFKVKPTYQKYIPHMTISYLVPGAGKYYRDKILDYLELPLEVNVKTLVYSVSRDTTTYKHSYSIV